MYALFFSDNTLIRAEYPFLNQNYWKIVTDDTVSSTALQISKIPLIQI